ncbi:Guanine exchange factor for Rac 30 [Clarias magur]|uniref:Guanine exchange factor for Rac 30 n=1 Tax=Clarias magur TaxID=1594786 RepID=A0A8J4UFJ4_CLAMG|nr:Guanine exchange factor for Rac 30 [Clarias magur]
MTFVEAVLITCMINCIYNVMVEQLEECSSVGGVGEQDHQSETYRIHDIIFLKSVTGRNLKPSKERLCGVSMKWAVGKRRH